MSILIGSWLFRPSRNKSKILKKSIDCLRSQGQGKALVDSKEPLKIPDNYFTGKDIVGTKRDLYTQYNTSAQNHSDYILSIGGTLLVLVGGWNIFSGDITLGIFMFVLASLTLLLTCRLMLRHKYWNIWSDKALLITEKEIIDNFNTCNERCKYYCKGEEPFCDAIFHIAVKQHVINM